MGTRHQTQFATVASGDTVSGTIGVAGAHINAIWSPVVDSCELRLQGSFDQTSANFVRMDHTQTDPGATGYTNPFLWLVGPGSKAIILSSAFDGPQYARIELSAAQTDTRTLAITLSFD